MIITLFLALSATGPKPAAQFCAALRPAVQALVKSPLSVKSADDATTDQLHTGEAGYYACVFTAPARYGITVILSDEKTFAAGEKGYQPLSGFGDRARFVNQSLRFVDVLQGKTFCEALVSTSDDHLVDPDWTHAGGKMCMAAIAAR